MKRNIIVSLLGLLALCFTFYTTNDNIKTEFDFYESNKEDTYLLKAIEYDFKGEQYILFSDLQGVFFVTEDIDGVENNYNYIVTTKDNVVENVEATNFAFTYEEDFSIDNKESLEILYDEFLIGLKNIK